MAPINRILLTAALIAIGAVDAKKPKLSVSQWSNTRCEGHVPKEQIEIKMGKCENIPHAESLKFHLPHKMKDAYWIKEHAQYGDGCYVETFERPNCATASATDAGWIPVPDDFEKCQHPSKSGVRSIRFDCHKNAVTPSGPRYVKSTTTLAGYTSYPDGRHTKTTTTMTTDVPDTTTYGLERAQTTPATDEVDPRAAAGKKWSMKGVWMRHPWTHAPLCYECWFNYKGKDQFECESTEQSMGICEGDPTASTTTTTVPKKTVSTTRTQGWAVYQVTTPVPAVDLEERSEKKLVKIPHPFLGTMTCAKAKWKNSGDHDQRVILKGPKNCKGKIDDWYPVGIKQLTYTETISTGTYYTVSTLSVPPTTIRTNRVPVPTTTSPEGMKVTLATLVAALTSTQPAITVVTTPSPIVYSATMTTLLPIVTTPVIKLPTTPITKLSTTITTMVPTTITTTTKKAARTPSADPEQERDSNGTAYWDLS